MKRREDLVDAAEACFTRFGRANTTVDDIAREAGVSRATVYRHVRDRDDLLLAVFAREADRLMVDMAAAGARSIVDGILFAVNHVHEHPLLLDVVRDPVPGAWEVCYERSLAHMGDELDPDAVEWVLRVVLSLLLLPSDRSDTALRAYLERMLPTSVRS